MTIKGDIIRQQNSKFFNILDSNLCVDIKINKK